MPSSAASVATEAACAGQACSGWPRASQKPLLCESESSVAASEVVTAEGGRRRVGDPVACVVLRAGLARDAVERAVEPVDGGNT